MIFNPLKITNKKGRENKNFPPIVNKAARIKDKYTAIFLRVVAEAALEQLESGAEIKEVTPFWRAVAPGDKVSSRLPVDKKWFERLRKKEYEDSVR